jgi:CRISPR-associated endonuclease Cas2
MQNKYKNKVEDEKQLTEIIGNFLHSNSYPATAAKFILASLALGGIAFGGAILPGIIMATKKFKRSQRYSKKQLGNSLYLLKSRKFIEIIQEGEETFRVQLTNKGQKRVKEFCFEALEIKKPAKWDKKWRILMFDIPTKPRIYNQAREALRQKIKQLGFYQMQKSAWVCPYECEDEILFIAELFQVQKHIEILTVEKLLHEDKLRKKFGL